MSSETSTGGVLLVAFVSSLVYFLFACLFKAELIEHVPFHVPFLVPLDVHFLIPSLVHLLVTLLVPFLDPLFSGNELVTNTCCLICKGYKTK